MIRIKPKTGPTKPKKVKRSRDDSDDHPKSKKSKPKKEQKPKVKKVKKAGKISKRDKPRKPGQFVLRPVSDDDNSDIELESTFPTSIDLNKQIKMLPRPDTQMNLTQDVKQMLKDADMGFSSISGVLETGDEEMGADEIRNSMKPEKKPYSGLPGWGNWANTKTMTQDIPVEHFQKKRAEFYKKRVHIEKDLKPNPHQVTEIPFPFESAEAYEASIAANLGPEFASRRLIRGLAQCKKKVEYENDETMER